MGRPKLDPCRAKLVSTLVADPEAFEPVKLSLLLVGGRLRWWCFDAKNPSFDLPSDCASNITNPMPGKSAADGRVLQSALAALGPGNDKAQR
jgi:hypothetical protein